MASKRGVLSPLFDAFQFGWRRFRTSVAGDLANTAGSSALGVWDVEVLGSTGADKIALFIADLVIGDITYQGGMALLDGGFGSNTFATGIPLPGANVRVLNV